MEDIPHYLLEDEARIVRDLEQAEWERDQRFEENRTHSSPLVVAHRHHRKRRPHCTPEEYSAPWNLLEVTPALHRWIHDNPGLSYARGWLVHSWDDPREVAVTPHPELREVA